MTNSADRAQPNDHRTGFGSTALPAASQRLVGQVLEFAGFVLLARALGPGDFGVLSAWYLVARYLGLISDWGAYAQGPRDVAAGADAASIRRYVVWRTQLTAGACVVFVGAALLLQPTVVPLVLCVLYRGLNRDWIALGLHRGSRAGVPAIVQGSVILCASWAVLLDASLAVAAVAVGSGYAASAIVSVALNRLGQSADDRGVGGVPPLQQPWSLVLILADQILVTADTVLLAWLSSSSEAGIYAAVYRVPNAWMTVVALLAVGLIPGMTASIRRDPSVARVLRRRVLVASGAAAAALAVFTPVALWVTPLLFGEDFDTGQRALMLLLAAAGFNTLAVMLAPLVFALGRERFMALSNAGLATIGIGLNLLLIPRFGMTGAASVTLAASAVSAVAYFLASRS
jgi:O-antigen/teichoic acid export membrane protein